MITLSFGYQKPESGDKGSIFFPALESNIQKVNDHNHDGVNSALIDSSNIARFNQTILAANWGATIGNGLYKQTINLPAGTDFDDLIMKFKISVGTDAEHIIYPDIKRLAFNQYEITVNDNTLEIDALYF